MIILDIDNIAVAECAPHKDVHDVNHELQTPWFKPLISENNVKTSLKCTTFDLSIMYQGHVKALWLIKRHANDDSHKVMAGWYLDGANAVLVSTPKSESNHILVTETLHSTRPIFVSSTFMALAVPSKRFLCGFPLLKTYTESREVNSISSPFLFLTAWHH